MVTVIEVIFYWQFKFICNNLDSNQCLHVQRQMSNHSTTDCYPRISLHKTLIEKTTNFMLDSYWNSLCLEKNYGTHTALLKLRNNDLSFDLQYTTIYSYDYLTKNLK